MSRYAVNLANAEALSPCARALTKGGCTTERLFESCGVPLEAVSAPGSFITMQQAHQVFEKAARYAGNECFGSEAGMDLKLYELGELGDAVQRAATLYDAGNVVSGAIQVSEPGSQCWITRHENEAWFCYRPIERFAVGGAQCEQFDLEGLLQFVRLAAGERWLPSKVRISDVTSKSLMQTTHFAESEVECGCSMTAIAFPSVLLHEPIVHAAGPARTAPSNRMPDPRLPVADSLSDAVGLVLDSLLPFAHLPNLDVMADRFGMNARTFQRLLSAEGSSYRGITERILFHRARHLLREPMLTIKEIAAELGYSSPSSFVRAFHRVAGTTPMVYRRTESRN
jgi:AraC-like DNA-binding protein